MSSIIPMELPKPYHEKRPWGDELWLTREAPSMVKVITVLPGQALSLQFHHNRDEFWHVLSGSGSAVVGTEKIPLHLGDEQFIPRETKHRLETEDSELVILELSYGDFDEKDIVRIEDRYGRS